MLIAEVCLWISYDNVFYHAIWLLFLSTFDDIERNFRLIVPRLHFRLRQWSKCHRWITIKQTLPDKTMVEMSLLNYRKTEIMHSLYRREKLYEYNIKKRKWSGWFIYSFVKYLTDKWNIFFNYILLWFFSWTWYLIFDVHYFYNDAYVLLRRNLIRWLQQLLSCHRW